MPRIRHLDMKKLYIAIFVIAFAALYIIAYVLPNISDVFVKSYTAEYGTIDSDEIIDYVIVRDEKVYLSDYSGNIDRVQNEGALLRRNSRIVNVGGEGHYSQKRGIVSFYYDGLEKKLTPKKIKNLSKKSIYPPTDENGKETYVISECKSDAAEKGDKIFKIVNNKEWYFVTFLEREDALQLKEGSNIKLELEDASILPCKIYYIGVEEEGQPKRDNIEVIFSCDRYLKNFDKLRYGKARFIKSSKTGIILETSSIVEEDGNKGVYVLNKYDDYVFTRISIIAEIGDKTVVEMNTFYDSKTDKVLNTVKNYDTVLRQKSSKDNEEKQEEEGKKNVDKE